jgi:4-amino-4-deoxy-L-arabinose transferase-like glycosyltransferase/lipid-A-disaccharide synthase-like uncharacterized protein
MIALGWIGQACFFSRSLYQWFESERSRTSAAPKHYWTISLVGSALVSIYAVGRAEWILLAGLLINGIVYARNLALGSRRRGLPRVPLALTGVAMGGVLLAVWAAQLEAPDALPRAWVSLAAVGQLLWSSRFLIQWLQAERTGRPSFGPAFWWVSLLGNLALLAYALRLGDPVFIAGYALGPVPQVRNLILLARQAPSPEPALARLRWCLVPLMLPLVYSAFARGLWAPDEPRYAEVAREIYEPYHGVAPATEIAAAPGWVMHLCGELYPDKPPLLYWLAGACGWMLEWQEFALRIPSLLSVLGTALLVGWTAKRWWGSTAGAWAPALLVGTAMMTEIGGRLQIDPLLTVLCCGSLLFADQHRHAQRAGAWLPAAGLLVGLAALAKGPVAYLHVGLPLVAWIFLERKLPTRPLLGRSGLLALLLAVVPVLLWAGSVSLIAPELAHDLFFGQHLSRAASGRIHAGPPWKYLLTLPLLLLPWTPVVLGGLRDLVPALSGRRMDAGLAKAGSWFLLVFVVFSLIPVKRDLYLLPLYPAAALLGARFLSQRPTLEELSGFVRHTPAVVFALLGSALVALPFVEIREFEIGRPELAVTAGLGLWVAAWMLRSLRQERSTTSWGQGVFATWGLGLLATAAVVFPPLDELKCSQELAERIGALPELPTKIPCIGVQPEGYRFYGAIPTVRGDFDTLLEHQQNEGAAFLALIRARDWADWTDPAKSAFEVLLTEDVGSKSCLLVGARSELP